MTQESVDPLATGSNRKADEEEEEDKQDAE